MSETRVREMLAELADTVPTSDLVSGRWADAVRVRRHRAGGRLVATVAVVTAIFASASLLGSDTTEPAPPAGIPAITPDPPDAVIAGHPVYLSPDVADEAILPAYQGTLPAAIDLRTPAGNVDRAVYAFAAPGSGLPLLMWLVGEDGDLQSVRVPPKYGMALDVSGTIPFNAMSLDTSGERVQLVTKDGWAIYDVAQETWTEHTGNGVSWRQRHRYAPSPLSKTGFPITDPWGPFRWAPDDRHGARSYFATGITEVDAGVSNPEVVEVQGTEPALLVINRGERFKGCCAVAGWLDDDWVVYESRTPDRMRLLAWNRSDGRFMRVAEVIGLPDGGVVGSYADLSQATRTGQ